MLFLFLFALDKIPVIVGKLAAENLDKVDKVPDTEQTGRQRIENTRADLADIVAVDAKPTTEEAEQERCQPVLRFDRNLRRDIVLYFLSRSLQSISIVPARYASDAGCIGQLSTSRRIFFISHPSFQSVSITPAKYFGDTDA